VSATHARGWPWRRLELGRARRTPAAAFGNKEGAVGETAEFCAAGAIFGQQRIARKAADFEPLPESFNRLGEPDGGILTVGGKDKACSSL
jgi:hypothetical protein